MRFRGEFIRADGLVIPNNVTLYGSQKVLTLAFTDAVASFWMALCNAQPDTALQIEDLNEPTIGVNGYARQQLARTAVGWPTVGSLNGEAYIESASFVFAAVGGPFDAAARRIALLESETDVEGDVIALSAAFPADLTVDTDTVIADRTFKYRLYGR